MKLLEKVQRARDAGVPLLGISTPDPAATMELVRDALAPGTPVLTWDGVDGLRAAPGDPNGEAARALVIGGDQDPTVGNPVAMLKLVRKLPRHSVVFMLMAHRYLENALVAQAVWTLRDLFKADFRTLVLLAPTLTLTPDLAGDVVILDEPLPDREALEQIVLATYKAAEQTPEGARVAEAVRAVQGLPAFQAETQAAMCMTDRGVDVDELWGEKSRKIGETPGLRVQRAGEGWEDVGGVAEVKSFFCRLLDGPRRYGAVVFVDEVEKHVPSDNAPSDSSGVNQDQLGVMLTHMQESDADGVVFVGPPGSAKSLVANVVGHRARVPTIAFDLGGFKGSLVGQSEAQIRKGLKVVDAVSNGCALWIATSNAVAQLPAAFRRRFGLGTWFFDIPSAALNERAAIWRIWMDKLGVEAQELPADEGWTGDEVRRCCKLSVMMRCSLLEAAGYIVPVSRSAPDQLARLREGATGRFLSASYPGLYRGYADELAEFKAAGSPGGRQVRVRTHAGA